MNIAQFKENFPTSPLNYTLELIRERNSLSVTNLGYKAAGILEAMQWQGLIDRAQYKDLLSEVFDIARQADPAAQLPKLPRTIEEPERPKIRIADLGKLL